MANAIQRANFYDYLAIVNADAVQRTSWWDYLPREIQIYIIQLAIRQRHRDQLGEVHQVMRHYWNICNCGPFHMLAEICFCEEYRIACGIRAFLTAQNRVVFRYQICCRRSNPIYRQFALEQEEDEE